MRRAATPAALLLIAATLTTYARTAGFGFISFDDPGYVTANPTVREGLGTGGLAWAFGAGTMANWHPLTWLSHMADVSVFGLRPAGHHLTSVALHAVSALLLYLALLELTALPWRSLVVAGLFALHPMHVESVAWIAERKDVLSGVFWHLTLLLYARWAASRRRGLYLLALGSFAAGLMAKPMLVSLPLVLLLVDLWPLRRLRPEGSGAAAVVRAVVPLVREKVPFLVLAAVSSALTVYAQSRGGAVQGFEKVSLGLRTANAALAYVRYLWAAAWPHDMAVLYPFPTEIAAWQLAGAVLLLALLSAGAAQLGRRHAYLVTGWLWFVVTLVPVIGLVQVGGQSHADRYTYLPYTGLFIAVTWGLADLARSVSLRPAILGALAFGAVGALGTATWFQLGYWRDSLTLYRHALDVTTGNYLMLNNYAIALHQERGDVEGAVRAYEEALRIWPGSAMSHNNLGALYLARGRYPEALVQFEEATRLDAGEPMTQVNIGRVLARLGRVAEAEERFTGVLRGAPGNADAHLELVIVCTRQGRLDEARVHYDALRRGDPSSARGTVRIAVELASAGLVREAAPYFADAVAIEPDSEEVHFNVGVFLAKQGRVDEAAAHFRRVLAVNPGSAMAQGWLRRIGR